MRGRRLQGDTRADAIGISRLFLSLGVGAVLVWILNEVTSPLFDHAKTVGSGTVATNGTTYLQEYIGFVIVLFLFISFFGLIAHSVYRRRVQY